MEQIPFGITYMGKQSTLFIMKNNKGMEIAVTNYGARLVSVKIPTKDGHLVDVVLGYDSVEDYEKDPYCFGATIGRNANRISNARFVLNGCEYHLAQNEYRNNSHSGPNGYQTRLWEVQKIVGNSVKFSLISPHLDQGFPGKLVVSVIYMLTDSNEVRIRYEGISDADTVINMTHHSYFNLNGHDSGNVLNQYLKINTKNYSPIRDYQCIPTGVHEPVEGTPMDFLLLKKIGRDIDEDFEQLVFAGDYNHNFILNKRKNEMGNMVEAYSRESGILMRAYTDLPAMQLYTGVYIKEAAGKDGSVYGPRSGFCLEAQYTPNAINEEHEEKPIFKAGEKYDKTVVYQFLNLGYHIPLRNCNLEDELGTVDK